MNDKESKILALEKTEIIKGIKRSLPLGWYWMVIKETPQEIVIKIRRFEQ